MARATKFQGIAILVSVVVVLALGAFVVVGQERQESTMEQRMDLMSEQMMQKMSEHCERMMGSASASQMMSGDTGDMSGMMSTDTSRAMPQSPKGMSSEEHLSHHQ
ncbi:hypothetical protein HY641_00525 [Candidatus Woesearchaeota archaeon]|nr:hypothetical protein [Candidatus Woesearchaeota archaeon]